LIRQKCHDAGLVVRGAEVGKYQLPHMIHKLLLGVLEIPLRKTHLYYTHAQKNKMYPTLMFKTN
jgi:succinate dehydrogenase hydrophobic anchor subunit